METIAIEKVTLEQLKKLNGSYDMEHGVKQSDVDKVNKIIERYLENDSNKLQAGDAVRLYESQGVLKYAHGHIDSKTNSDCRGSICTQASAPNIRLSDNSQGYVLSTSGGYWLSMKTPMK